jgi:hypothetical protein
MDRRKEDNLHILWGVFIQTNLVLVKIVQLSSSLHYICPFHSFSLGAFHDGSGESENCSVRQNFMMAPMSAAHPFDAIYGDTFPNAFRLSECSLHQIQDFLKYFWVEAIKNDIL